MGVAETVKGGKGMRLRQIALVARELEPVVADLCAVLGIEIAFRDPGVGAFGLHNAVMPIGDTFLEVVSPLEPNTTAGRFLERRGGDGGYMVILQCDDLDAQRTRLATLGVRIVWSTDLDDARTIHLHPRDIGGAIVSLDAMIPPESWRWAGPSWRERVRTDTVAEITGVEIQSDDPLALAQRWSRVLNRPVAHTMSGIIRIVLDQGSLCFVTASDGRGEGVGGFEVAVRDRERLLSALGARRIPVVGHHVVICGTRISFKAV
jgi:glyoxalase-like protein